jgi:hypothetical protein
MYTSMLCFSVAYHSLIGAMDSLQNKENTSKNSAWTCEAAITPEGDASMYKIWGCQVKAMKSATF